MWSTCFGSRCKKSPSPPPIRKQKTLQTALTKELLILLQQPNVSRAKKQLIQREIKRRNKNNYGYELAKMFGVSPPPTNKLRVEHGNIHGRLAKQSGVNLRFMYAPEHAVHFMKNVKPPKPNNQRVREYRFKRKLKRVGLEMIGIQTPKQLKSLQRANNYATGRSQNRPSNSSMRYYFKTHPRPAQMNARTVNNLRRALKERIQTNLFEYINVPPNRNNLRQKWEILTNRNQVRNMENLVRKMRRYRRAAETTWDPHNAQTFANLYNRAKTRNSYGFYYR